MNHLERKAVSRSKGSSGEGRSNYLQLERTNLYKYVIGEIRVQEVINGRKLTSLWPMKPRHSFNRENSLVMALEILLIFYLEKYSIHKTSYCYWMSL